MTTLRQAAEQALEALEAITGVTEIDDVVRINRAIPALRQALEAVQQDEPYAYAVYFPDQPNEELVHDLEDLCDEMTDREHSVVSLYTHPQPAQHPAIPQGWKLVPVEPTSEMLQATVNGYAQEFRAHRMSVGKSLYRTMLAAAPEVQVTGLNLNCKSTQKRLATLWGFAPAQQPLTQQRIQELADEGVFHGNIFEIVRRIEEEHGTFKTRPLTDEDIANCAVGAQFFFARNFGGAPTGWTNEQVRRSQEFQDAIRAIVRSVERAHLITGETK